MIRKAAITATLVLGILVTIPRTAPVYGRLVASAQKFQQHFHDLGGSAGSLSPIERFFFSLALTTTSTPAPPAAAGPSQRT